MPRVQESLQGSSGLSWKRMRDTTRVVPNDVRIEGRVKRLKEQKKKEPSMKFSVMVNRAVIRSRKAEYPINSQIHSIANWLPLNAPDPPTPYEALSYTWGNENPSAEIKIFDPDLAGVFHSSKRGHGRKFQAKFWSRFYIRPNLHEALRHLRKRHQKTVLWVDALCMNQSNLEERSNQVTKMADIYSRAKNVCIWLGDGNLENQLAFDFIAKLLPGDNLDTFLRDETTLGHWMALAEVMRSQWFSRRWIVQEVALAKQASLHCGKSQVHWEDFKEAVSIFVEYYDTVETLARNSSRYGQTYNPLGNIRTGAVVLVETINNSFRNSGHRIERLATLETLVSTLLSFDASEPRDIVYAALSMAKDTVEGDPSNALRQDGPPLVPDYTKSLMDVCKDFVDFAISRSESLDIICRHWAPVVKKQQSNQANSSSSRGQQDGHVSTDQLPSWLSAVSHGAYGTPIDHFSGRMNGDSFVGISGKNYNATPKTTARWRFGEVPRGPIPVGSSSSAHEQIPNTTNNQSSSIPSSRNESLPRQNERAPCNGSLFVKGFILDTVGQSGTRIAQGVIPRESLILGGVEVADDDDENYLALLPDEIWRTMVANRGAKGETPEAYYHRACLKCLAQSIRGDIDINKLIAADNDGIVSKFLRRVRCVVWNRKFIRSAGTVIAENRGALTPKELFGLAPADTEVGDKICILLGCTVPVILRDHRTRPGCYTLIGEAYVHGMMDGEALGGRRQQELERTCREFELI